MPPVFHQPAVADLAPIIVTSPSIRCGTTLVQRLLCSSPDTLIYGEPCGVDLEFGIQVLAHKLMLFGQHQTGHARLREVVLSGAVDAWISDLIPSPDTYLDGLRRGCTAGLVACRDDALANGRTLWGVKYPGWSPWTAAQIRELLPKSRWIVVNRDLEGVLKSAKTWNGINSAHDVNEFCRNWAANHAFYQGWRGDPNALLLDYAELMQNQDASLAALRDFTGASAINAGVMSHKVNSLDGGYRAPIALTDSDREIVASALASIKSPA